MSVLDEIKKAVSTFDDRVFYGTAAALPKDAPWNYTVFSRGTTERGEGNRGYTENYTVAVVREGFVDEELFDTAVDAVESIPGMRLSPKDTEYVYQAKGKSGVTVEMMVLHFCRSRKRCRK